MPDLHRLNMRFTRTGEQGSEPGEDGREPAEEEGADERRDGRQRQRGLTSRRNRWYDQG